MKKGLFIAVLVLLPSFAFAAGFPKTSLFLSATAPKEGEGVVIYAPVENPATAAFSGKVVFADEGQNVGSVTVRLAAGEARIVSVSWTPLAPGSHSLTATLQKDGGDTIDTLSGSFAVAAKTPAATAQDAAAIESSSGIQNNVDKISPAVGAYVAPGFAAIDAARNAAADVLDGQLASTKEKLGPGGGDIGQVLGSEDIQHATEKPVNAGIYFLRLVYFYILTLLRFIIGSAAVFYPVFLLLALYIIWKLFRRFRRPAY